MIKEPLVAVPAHLQPLSALCQDPSRYQKSSSKECWLLGGKSQGKDKRGKTKIGDESLKAVFCIAQKGKTLHFKGGLRESWRGILTRAYYDRTKVMAFN